MTTENKVAVDFEIRLRRLTFFFALAILVMEILVLYQVSTTPVSWQKQPAMPYLVIAFLSTATIAVGATACTVHYKRSFLHVAFLIFWTVLTVTSGQDWLERPQEAPIVPLVVCILLSIVYSLLFAMSFLQGNGKIVLPSSNPQYQIVHRKFIRTFSVLTVLAFALINLIFEQLLPK